MNNYKYNGNKPLNIEWGVVWSGTDTLTQYLLTATITAWGDTFVGLGMNTEETMNDLLYKWSFVEIILNRLKKDYTKYNPQLLHPNGKMFISYGNKEITIELEKNEDITAFEYRVRIEQGYKDTDKTISNYMDDLDTIINYVHDTVDAIVGEKLVTKSFVEIAEKHASRVFEFYDRRETVNAEFVKSLRTRLGMNQYYFARVLGVKQATISKWESGSPISQIHALLLYTIDKEPNILDYAFYDTSFKKVGK